MEKYLPFPVLFDSLSTVHRMTATQYGITRLLVESFWRTGQPLPSTDKERMRIARTDEQTYHRHKALVDKVLEELFPEVERLYVKQLGISSRRSEVARERIKKNPQWQKNIKRGKPKLSDADSSHGQISPLPPVRKPFNEGMTDKKAREKVLRAPDQPGKPMFTDS